VLVLGLVLVLLAAAAGAAVLVPALRDAIGLADPGLELAFALGAVTAAVAVLGLLLMTGGSRRRAARRHAERERSARTRSEADDLAKENDRLHGRLEQERSRPVTPYPSDADAARQRTDAEQR
jgi:hypothetical protein